jgi:HK97 gp10 family phage protein
VSIALEEIQGWDAFLKTVEKLPDRQKRSEILKVLRRVAKPMVSAARSRVRIADRVVYRYVRGGRIEQEPRTLQKSIGIITGRNRNYPNVLVGPRAGGRKKYDGWFGHFLEFGTRNAPAFPFMRPAFNQTKTTSVQLSEKLIAAQLQKSIDKYVHK